MAVSTVIRSELGVDAPLALTADYHIGSTEDRRYADEQIRGIELHLVESLIRGTQATWVKVDSGSASLAIGDVVSPAATAADAGTRTVYATKATIAALGAAGFAFGVCLTAGVPNGWVLVARSGILPASITGLAAGAAGPVRVHQTTGRCERMDGDHMGYPIGYVDAAGNLHLLPARPQYLDDGGTSQFTKSRILRKRDTTVLSNNTQTTVDTLQLPEQSVSVVTLWARGYDRTTGDAAGYLRMAAANRHTVGGTNNLQMGSTTANLIGEQDTAWDATITINGSTGEAEVKITSDAANTCDWEWELEARCSVR